ncbi:NADH-ubiquinone oxidoreductase complex I, 21 kDa subunit-domain-containing protein [Lipomyces kononenkoae]|uniref:NADH-ubiquinone oxidoreductase complex I, 21 kDa subunit-domain-containing protein n=1 Tax=Lipomyces kononenkoae TaxID=34357 RepID=A0ACC3SZM2_LIPKO
MSEEGLPVIPKGDYPLIDADPHFSRVIRYFRFSDIGIWAAVTASAPLLVGLMDYNKYNQISRGVQGTIKGFLFAARQRQSMFGPAPSLFLGVVGGFLIAYQRSSYRFLGYSENAREQAKDLEELSSRAKAGLPIYGTSALNPELQKVAASYSRLAVFKFSVFPLFNFVNHPYHGVDTSKYYK